MLNLKIGAFLIYLQHAWQHHGPTMMIELSMHYTQNYNIEPILVKQTGFLFYGGYL